MGNRTKKVFHTACQAAANADQSNPPPTVTERTGIMSNIPLHDFCFTIPYGFILLLGGVIGAVFKGSMKSLMYGGGSGALIMGLGFLSLKVWKSGSSSTPITVLSTALAAGLTYMM